ncbi:MAG: 50S ribosomal protein L17 [bacterium]|nr:50S ribosomal protein L17 [bacterium]
MHKRKVGRTFSRKTDQRRAFLLGLERALILENRIHTTDARAREIRPRIERLVTHAKKGTLAARRQLIGTVGGEAAKKMFEEIAKRYTERSGGYTRIIKKEPRKSDGARLAIIEFV